jgi:uncharacterized peroxidase-related enzyme
MSRIAPLDPADAQGTPKELLDQVQASLGATPNMAKVMARSSVLGGWLALNGVMGKGSIRRATGERIALAVAESNGCRYCLSAHTFLGTNVAKLSDAEIAQARKFESEDPKAAAILAFAQAVLQSKGAVSEEEIAEARAAGLSDAELGDTVGHVALNVLTNYFNNAFDVEIDFPVVQPHATAA